MTSPDLTPLVPDAPVLPPATEPRKRVLWKWSIAVTVVVFGFLLWQCGSAVNSGRQLSSPAVERFHDELNAEEYEQIYAEADDAFRGSGKKEETIKFLRGVHHKLGNAGEKTLSNVMVQATTGGTFVIATYATKFARGDALEKFTWVKLGGKLVLRGYNVQSNAFIVN